MTTFTFVSSYFELQPSYTNTYFHNFKRLSSLGFPIVLFLDSKLKHRKPELESSNVFIEIMDWDEFPINKFRLEHYNGSLERPRYLNETKDTEQYMLLMNTKPFFLLKASQLYKFETYVWIDFGILKLTNNLEHVRFNFSKLKKYSNIIIPGGFGPKGFLSDDQMMNHLHWRFLGGIVICPSQCIQPFYEYTFNEVTRLISKHKITWELNIWANIESRHPGLIQYYSADCNPKIFGFYDKKNVIVYEINEPDDISKFQTWLRYKNLDFQAVCFISKTRDELKQVIDSLYMKLIPTVIISNISHMSDFYTEIGWDPEFTNTIRL